MVSDISMNIGFSIIVDRSVWCLSEAAGRSIFAWYRVFFFSKKWLKLASLSHCVDEINHLAQVKVIYAYATYTEQ